MKDVLYFTMLLLALALGLRAQTAPDAAELTTLLNEFLAGASRNDAAMHDRFWADDLIYTGSSGRRVGKADIMRDVRSAKPNPAEPVTAYTAEDVRIQQYGDTAIVAFRLVGTTAGAVRKYLNSGTFLKRNGKWQAVNWQATALPRTPEEVKQEVAAVETAFHQALAGGDVKKVEALVDDSFVWLNAAGEQMARREWIERIVSKRMRRQPGDAVITAFGDAAIVRRGHILTFVNKGGAWKAVALIEKP